MAATAITRPPPLDEFVESSLALSLCLIEINAAVQQRCHLLPTSERSSRVAKRHAASGAREHNPKLICLRPQSEPDRA